jgi:hypothetical protein
MNPGNLFSGFGCLPNHSNRPNPPQPAIRLALALIRTAQSPGSSQNLPAQKSFPEPWRPLRKQMIVPISTRHSKRELTASARPRAGAVSLTLRLRRRDHLARIRCQSIASGSHGLLSKIISRSAPRARPSARPPWTTQSRAGDAAGSQSAAKSPSDVGGLIPSRRLGRLRPFLDWARRQLQYRSPLPRSEVSDKNDCTV